MRAARLLAIVAVLVWGAHTPSSQAPGVVIPETVTAAVAADGVAMVIVGVRAPFVPEGYLASDADVADQRQAIQAVLDSVTGQAAAVGALIGHRFDTIPFFSARVDAGALAALAAMPEVAFIEADSLLEPSLLQSVPIVNAPAAWSAGHTGAGWHVAIVDTGVEKTHGFLTGKVVQEACYSNANGAGVGISTCPGGATSSTAVGSGVPCTSSLAECDHGTHVAGIAAGANGPSGTNGVAPGANLFAFQVFTTFTGATCTGGGRPSPCVSAYTSDIVSALERALALTGGTGNPNQVASVNMSLGGGGPFTFSCDASNVATKTAIDNLLSRGVATVVASGNNGFTTGVSTPACISTAVSVGSTNESPEVVSNFTNRGSGKPYLLAPGSVIRSSVVGNAFGDKQGTSMATPHVAGAWAVLKQARPTAGVAQVLGALQSTGAAINDPASDPTVATPQAVYSRINVNAARLALIAAVGTVPGAPGTPVITGSGTNVTITWTAPSTGGTPTGYTLIARAGGPGGAVLLMAPVGNVLSYNVPAAPNGTFHVSVQATNSAGAGPESAGVTFAVPILTPPPGAPTNLAASVSGNQATFTWTPPSTGGPTTGYLIVAALTAGGAPIATLPFSVPPTPSVVVTNIPPGTYFVKLAATNAGGAGPFSNEVTVSVAGPQVPGAPTLNPATVSGNTVGLSWTPGGGGMATSYAIVAALAAGGAPIATLPVGATPTAISVPAPTGTYFVRIHGVNAVGTGPASNEIMVVVP